MAIPSHTILGISGSLRAQSSNSRLLAHMADLLSAQAVFRSYAGLAELPHFNPDADKEGCKPAAAVQQWREALRQADAVVICTPEYARGVPGSLKNALDWIVSSGEFVNKPTAIVTASPSLEGGATALHAIVQTLRMMDAAIPESAMLAVPQFGTHTVLNEQHDASLRQVLDALLHALQNGA